jgi:hypothetical protein
VVNQHNRTNKFAMNALVLWVLWPIASVWHLGQRGRFEYRQKYFGESKGMHHEDSV